MEAREILIANTKTQKRSKITTNATTLGELKAALTAANVDYYGMTFTEGISKTQLLDDTTQLPQNVMYKGQTTNNLVILLTNTKKNIASGVMAGDRNAAYNIIKENGLQDAVKETFGRNFTQVSTADLCKFINDGELIYKNQEAGENQEEEINDDIENEDIENDTEGENISNAVYSLVTLLYNTGVLSATQVKNLCDDIVFNTGIVGNKEPKEEPAEPVSTSDGSINDDDIDSMLNELGV